MLKLLSILLASHFLAQAAQLLAGPYIVRELQIREYAVYTLFSVALGTWSAFGDLGLSQLLVARGAKISNDEARLRQLIAYVIRWSAGLTIVAGIFVSFYFQNSLPNGFDVSRRLAFFGLLSAQAAAAMFERISLASRTLRIDMETYARATVNGSAARAFFLLVFLGVAPSWETAVASILLGSLVTIGTVAMRSSSTPFGVPGEDQAGARTDRAMLLASWRHLLPVALYGMIQGQLPVLLAANTATLADIAAFGALTRVGQAVLIVGVLNSVLLNSYLARLSSDRRKFARVLLLFLVSYLGYIALLAGMTHAWPNTWLVVIGWQYAAYAHLLLPMVLVSGAGLIATALYFATVALERLEYQWLHIVGGSAAALSSLYALGWRIESTTAMILLAVAITASGLVVQAGILGRELLRGR